MGELFDKYQVIHNEESKKSAAPKPAPPPSETIKPVSELPSAQTLGQSSKDTKRTGLGRMRGVKRKRSALPFTIQV